MYCAITGANGFVGSHLVDRLVAEGHQVCALVRATSDLQWLKNKPVTLIKGDLDDAQALKQAFTGVSVVFHVAGVVNSLDSDTFFRVNAEGTRKVAEACLEVNPKLSRFVLVSSQSVVGPNPGGTPMNEEIPCRPINLYGKSKLAGEEAARKLMPALPLSIIRPGPIYGPRDREALALIQMAAKGFHVKVGLARRMCNFCHVEDVVTSLMLAATREEALGETFLISDTQNYTVQESGRIMSAALRDGRKSFPLWLPVSVAYAAGAVSGAIGRLRHVTPDLNLDRVRMLTARGWAMDTSKAQKLLGYTPQYDLASGVVQTVKWCKEHGWM